MNITILSLVSSSLVSTSPIFVGNSLSMIKTNFNHFATSLFYNQNNIFIQNSIFSNALGNYIIISSNDQPYTEVNDESYCYKQDFNELKTKIENTKFINIYCSKQFIHIYGTSNSLEISNCYFINCSSSDAIISIKECNSIKIERSYSIKSSSHGSNCIFMNGILSSSNSLINLTSITDSVIDKPNQKEIYINNKCNMENINISRSNMNGIEFSNPQDASIKSCNIWVSSTCLSLSSKCQDLKIDDVYFYSFDCYHSAPCIKVNHDSNK